MVRPPCCDKLNARKNLWTEEEDAKILDYVSKHGTGDWTGVPRKAGIKRCGKSCRLRWSNYLKPDLRHGGFTSQEEEMIIRLHAAIGSRWSIIAQQLPGRTDNDVKNYWNTKLKKKLTEMGIDPVTHRPFSQILADYANIGNLPKIGSLSRDFKNVYASKQEQSDFIPQDGYPNQIPLQPNTNSPLDLLAQLQAITIVTEASNNNNSTNVANTITNHEATKNRFNSDYSSISSSSSSALAMNQVNFSWRDFLLDDQFLPDSGTHQEDIARLGDKEKGEEREDGGRSFAEASSSCDGSFVEAMLHHQKQNDMVLEFSGGLEESFFY